MLSVKKPSMHSDYCLLNSYNSWSSQWMPSTVQLPVHGVTIQKTKLKAHRQRSNL